MTDTITLTGVVATVPKQLTTGTGLAITSFRLASAHRRFDKGSDSWVDGDTNWYGISTFRRLAAGSAASIRKGDHVILTGRLRLREWKSADKAGTSIEVDAVALGHDLSWGTAVFSRTNSGAAAADPEDESHQDVENDSDREFVGESPSASDGDSGWAFAEKTPESEANQFPVVVGAEKKPDTPF